MTDEHQGRPATFLRQAVSEALDTAAEVIERTLDEHPLRPGDARRILVALQQSPWFDSFCARIFAQLERHVGDAGLRSNRKDLFRRVLVHPIGPLLDSHRLDRGVLSNYFAFFKHLLGDDVDGFRVECAAVAEELENQYGEDFDWHLFYGHPRVKAILFQIWTRIARSFKRFALRRDWFIDLMSYDPVADPISAHLYIERKSTGEEPPPAHPFTGEDFTALFSTLFAEARHLPPADRELFKSVTGQTPEAALGPFLSDLDTQRDDDDA